MKVLLIPLVLAATLSAGAQTVSVHEQAARAANPASPTAPTRHEPMAPSGISGLATERDDWKAANATVGQYQRGHMDILRSERAQDARPQPEREMVR